MKKPWWLIPALMLLAVLVLPTTTEAQVIYVNGVAYVPANGYYGGIPAAHGPVSNGSVRHLSNGYVGVNSRHYSRIPMKWGTGPIRATGPIVTYPRYGGHGYHGGYRGGYAHGYARAGGGHVGGRYAGNGWYIQGAVSFR